MATLSPSVTWPLPAPVGPATTTAAASSKAASARSWLARAVRSTSVPPAVATAAPTHASVRASALDRLGTDSRRWLELRLRGGAPPKPPPPLEVVLLRRCRSSPPRGVSGSAYAGAGGARAGAAELVLVRGPPIAVVVVAGSADQLVCHNSRDTLLAGGRRSVDAMVNAAPLRRDCSFLTSLPWATLRRRTCAARCCRPRPCSAAGMAARAAAQRWSSQWLPWHTSCRRGWVCARGRWWP